MLEFDEVTLSDDMNDSINDVLDRINNPLIYDPALGRMIDRSGKPDTSELESLNLYYVSVTRSAKRLYNAKHIK